MPNATSPDIQKRESGFRGGEGGSAQPVNLELLTSDPVKDPVSEMRKSRS